MAYKEKTCPACGVKHNKRGEFCSRSCGNKRKHTESTKEKISSVKKEWHATSDIAEIAAHNFISAGRNKEPDPVSPPVRAPIRDNQFIADGDLWTECD